MYTENGITDDFLKSDSFNFAGKIDIDLSSDIGKLLKEFLKQLEETPASTAISIFIDELGKELEQNV